MTLYLILVIYTSDCLLNLKKKLLEKESDPVLTKASIKEESFVNNFESGNLTSSYTNGTSLTIYNDISGFILNLSKI